MDDESSLQKYDAIIIGAPVYRVKFPRCTSKFIRSHINELKKIKCAFFSVSLTAISKKQEDIEAISQLTNEFPMNLDWKPDRVESFAGALAYTKYNIFLRFIIKMMVKSHDGDTDTTRDYEYTNWNDVQKFSHEFLSLN
ncbi:MAG: menaquinone-dependent protoporphyrinogen oxidase [Planctomycetota bacterium]